MTTTTFSRTSLPPIVRPTNSADAPVRVSMGTQPNPFSTIIRIIGAQALVEGPVAPTLRATVKPGVRVRARARR